MRNASVWARLLGVERTVVEAVGFDLAGQVLVCHVRPVKGGAGAVRRVPAPVRGV